MIKILDLSNKEEDVYIPLLNAFKDELIRQNKFEERNIPKVIAEYLLGKFDFYKLISVDNKKTTRKS